MRIIPAIDIIEGKCVRLTKGDYSTKKIYNEDPLKVAKEFEDNGIKFLHVVDLDGARSGNIVNYRVLETIASKTNLIIDFGGGLKSERDLEIAFDSGASQITGGSIAVNERDTFLSWLQRFGSERIILGADCKDRMIATNGWEVGSTIDILDFIQSYELKGVQSVISTDISKDGMLEGPSLKLYAEILDKSNVQLIASGGVSNMQDLYDLKELGCSGAIVGKAIYEGNISLQELSKLC